MARACWVPPWVCGLAVDAPAQSLVRHLRRAAGAVDTAPARWRLRCTANHGRTVASWPT